MKLLTKTALVYIAATLLLFIAGGIIFYFQLKSRVNEEVTENLVADKQKVEEYFKIHGTLPGKQVLFNGQIDSLHSAFSGEKIYDTMIYNRTEEELLEYKVINFQLKNDTSAIAVSLSIPAFESDDLIEAVGISLLIITAILLVILLLVNGIFSFRLWRPFFRTINEIKKYDVNEHHTMTLTHAKTKEFVVLNKEIQKMTDKIRKNYIQLRAFTENASHEIQTPLASLLLEAEQMLQKTDLSGDMVVRIQNIYNTALRLGKINETLLLLAKIGNDQFPKSNIDLAEIVKAKIEHQQEMIRYKNIEVLIDIREPLLINMNPELADILAGNLISNAIRHNIEHGTLKILIDQNGMTITNTGKPLVVEPDELFERFKKNDQSAKSLGLGLAIVKQIADLYKFNIKYNYQNGNHIITVGIS